MPEGHDSGSPAKRASDRERKVRTEIKECVSIIESTIIRKIQLENELNKIFGKKTLGIFDVKHNS